MDNNRLIAIACGLIVMLVIIMVCRGCMGKPDTSGLKKPKKSEPVPTGITIQTGTTVTKPPVLDIFGRPVTTDYEVTAIGADTETTTEAVIETDIFGNAVTTAETVETDIFGMEVTTIFPETTTESVAEPVTEEITEETTLSLIEQYEKDLNDPHSIGGFNHGNYDEDGNPVPTLPPDFAIIIN